MRRLQTKAGDAAGRERARPLEDYAAGAEGAGLAQLQLSPQLQLGPHPHSHGWQAQGSQGQ
jgi:hypothetical protein